MSVWLCIPSARSPEEANAVLKLWRERGYKIALWVDSVADGEAKICGHWINGKYFGYAQATNSLIETLISDDPINDSPDPQAEWFVIGGDDVEPDLNHSAEEIARECREHFAGTFGAMQPTGDRWGENDRHLGKRGSAYIDRVCGSAWLGREFCRRVNRGNGPLWPEYFHMSVDEELQCVAQRLGVLWQRRDLVHLHRHWGRQPGATAQSMPAFLAEANRRFPEARALFEKRKAAGFPGSELAE